MIFTPVPAATGLNIFPLTPEPLYMPPAGVPPVSANGAASIQTDELDGQVTTGKGTTADGDDPFRVVGNRT